MKNLFFKHFGIENSNVISVSGDGDNTALIHLLAKESVEAGFRTLVVGVCEQKYPVEGKVLISDETELLLQLIRDDEPEVTYLARKIKADLLFPFKSKELAILLKQVDRDIKVFFNVDLKKCKPASYNKILKGTYEICTINFNILREHLLKIYQNTTIRSSSTAQKKIQKYFFQLIEEYCPNYSTKKGEEAHILFVDQVKNLLDENLLIPVARNLHTADTSKILYGQVHQYNLKEI